MEATATDNLPKRPISVVLLQIAIALFIMVYLWSLASGIYNATRPGSQVPAPGLAVAVMLRMLPLVFLGYTLWALGKRRPSGRWLGLLCIIALPASRMYQLIHHDLPHPFSLRASTDPQKIGEAFGEAFGYALTAWWFFAFGFSSKAKAFFAGPRSP